MRKNVRQEKIFFFFWLRSGSTLFAHALRRSAGKQPAPVGIFFVNFDFISLCLLYTPLIHDTFYSHPYFASQFFLNRDTHTKKKTPHNVRKRLIRAAAPPSSLFWLCHVCVCVCVNVSARAQRHLFFLPLKNFRSPCHLYERFSVWLWKKKITHKTLPTTTTKTHTNITTTPPPPPWSVQPLSPFIYWREIFELKEEEEKFWSVPCLFL